MDEELMQVMRYVRSEKWPTKMTDNIKPYFNRRQEISIENGIMLWGHRIIIPKRLRNRILQEKTKTLARSIVYWPNIDKDIETKTKSCHACLINKPDPPKTDLTSWSITYQPFERVFMDLLGHLRGKMYLVVVDAYSKWMEVCKMKNTTAFEVEKKLRKIFAQFGSPKEIVSDNGPQMVAKPLTNFFKINGIKHILTPPFHPQSNGAAESTVKIFKGKIKTAIDNPRNIQIPITTLIARFLLAYRSTEHTSTGKTPASLMFGREIRIRLQILREDSEVDQEIRNQKQECELAEVVKTRNQSKKFYRGRRREFEPGEDVIWYEIIGT